MTKVEYIVLNDGHSYPKDARLLGNQLWEGPYKENELCLMVADCAEHDQRTQSAAHGYEYRLETDYPLTVALYLDGILAGVFDVEQVQIVTHDYKARRREGHD